ncbi:hypothetical protein [uncultured Ruegeria sp.]|uniref:hypothetical protein n=1 Tax=uncultured Ruegeria sp. TaxID=259304 RepID=UPI0026147F4C|nr:hypothetical protein [uncultured Ruegeria sp.]
MADESFASAFKAYCAAQYGAADPSDLPIRQKLEAEDAFYAGAQHGFYSGFGAIDDEAFLLDRELRAFGENIVKRYADAGLPLGQRRS